MEKYGFVYLWFDKKHKRYYVGCHWGTEDDGYICSSRIMKKAYKRRPNDFKRRILSRIYTNKKDLLEEEYRYLNMIKDHELKVRYYNLHNYHFKHWSSCESTTQKVSEKVSNTLKRKHKEDSEFRKMYEESIANRDCRRNDPEVVEKQRRSIKATLAEKFPVENRKYPYAKRDPNTGEYTEIFKKRLNEGVQRYWSSLSEEELAELKQKRSDQAKERKGFYCSNRRKGVTNSSDHNLKIGRANGKPVIIDGVEYYSKCEAARALGITDATVNNRIKSLKYPTWNYI